MANGHQQPSGDLSKNGNSRSHSDARINNKTTALPAQADPQRRLEAALSAVGHPMLHPKLEEQYLRNPLAGQQRHLEAALDEAERPMAPLRDRLGPQRDWVGHPLEMNSAAELAHQRPDPSASAEASPDPCDSSKTP